MNIKNGDIIANDPRQNEIKICSICGEHKERKYFTISKVKSNGTVVRRSACQSCDVVRQRNIRRSKGIVSNLIPTKEVDGITLYQCDVCKQFKPKAGFPKESDSKNTLGFRRPCKQCRKHCHRELRTSDVEFFLSEQQEEERDKHYGSINRIKQVLLNLAKVRSKRDGIEFDLTLDDFDIPKLCPILNIKLIPGIGKQSPNSPSIDRIDGKRGYVKNNVCVISYRANAMKNDASIDELRLFAKNILSYIKDDEIVQSSMKVEV